MKLIKYLFFLFTFFFVACGEDEPAQNLFSIAVQLSGKGQVTIGQRDCEITVNGYGQYITVDLLGDFDSFHPSVHHMFYQLLFLDHNLSIFHNKIIAHHLIILLTDEIAAMSKKENEMW